MSAILDGFTVTLCIVVGSYVLVYAFAAWGQDKRLFTARRLRAVVFGTVELHGGPFDGLDFTAPRLRRDVLGLSLAEWPNVLYDGRTRTYQFGPRPEFSTTNPTVWAGYYMLSFLADRYEWRSVHGERWAHDIAERVSA